MTGSGDTNRDVVDRAKAVLENVTAAPWRTEPGDEVGDAAVFVDVGPSLFWCPDCGTNAEAGGREAAFIVAARTLVPELVAEIERLRALDFHARAFAERLGEQ